jgi:citrate/tricarballylate utilization protein
MPDRALLEEAERQLRICNACRYCEGYCAVFPMMELRRAFTAGDIIYLAQLCHDCRGCYYACMYTPPHPFAVNIPQIMSAVRVETYRRHTWPGFMRVLFGSRRVALGLLAAAVVAVTALTAWLAGSRLTAVHTGPGAFYAVIPHGVMLTLGLGLGAYWMAVWAVAGVRFWRECAAGTVVLNARALLGAVWDVLRMRWLAGAGAGCPYPGEQTSHRRRWAHSLVFYGFAAAFASTTVAAIYQELLGRLPPYPLLSAPVMLGSLGGVAMIAGCLSLWVAKGRSDPDLADPEMLAGDELFLLTLGMTSVTGMLVLALRATPLMGLTLAVHLGVVVAFYITAAHGKFLHVVPRVLALIRSNAERQVLLSTPGEDAGDEV